MRTGRVDHLLSRVSVEHVQQGGSDKKRIAPGVPKPGESKRSSHESLDRRPQPRSGGPPQVLSAVETKVPGYYDKIRDDVNDRDRGKDPARQGARAPRGGRRARPATLAVGRSRRPFATVAHALFVKTPIFSSSPSEARPTVVFKIRNSNPFSTSEVGPGSEARRRGQARQLARDRADPPGRHGSVHACGLPHGGWLKSRPPNGKRR